MTVRSLLTSALFLQFVFPASSTVDPSKCIAIWTFRLPCSEPVSDLMNQLKAWSTKKCRDGPEKCMYKIMNESPEELEIKHTSPQSGKITEINFFFGPTAAKSFCKIKAISTTKSKNGTNPNDYCLLYNLIDASGLTQAEGYKEICNKEKCPSMSSAHCDKDEDF
ncbi:hypothetical protein ILYODFUR_027949 [Ilyodon furcidens]|uniref:Uncharacterized protein n=1 Tax=Ilyodon furcidens TaxID=33524 RepID=A0ABV0VJA6_9TELE